MLSGSSISDMEYRIEASLIGKNVRIGRRPALPKAYRFVVGDNADVQICSAQAPGSAGCARSSSAARMQRVRSVVAGILDSSPSM